MTALDLVKDLSPRPTAIGLGLLERPAAIEFCALRIGELDVSLWQAIPEVFSELNALLRGQMTEVKQGRRHERKTEQASGGRQVGETLRRRSTLSRQHRPTSLSRCTPTLDVKTNRTSFCCSRSMKRAKQADQPRLAAANVLCVEPRHR